MIRIVAISDTHNRHAKITIPPCDILIHAGDATLKGCVGEVTRFAKWFNEQPALHKVYVPGNHELFFEKDLPASKLWFHERCPDGILLIDEAATVMGIRIYGSPATPIYKDWAFNRARNQKEADFYRIREIKPHWDAIPTGTNVLITHGPPYDVLDDCIDFDSQLQVSVGCEELAKAVTRIKPDLHIFGHIHARGGHQIHRNGTSYYNVAVCDEKYHPSNPITIIDYET